jgi:hypothetical protein
MNLLEKMGTSAWAQGFKPVSCSDVSCGRWLTHRQLSVSCVGVTMADNWYCSYRCFRAAAQEYITKLMSTRAVFPGPSAHPPLGLDLLRRGLITESEYKEARQIQRRSREDFGDIVLRLGLLTEREVTRARAEHWGCPLFSADNEVARSAFRIPLPLMKRYSMAPLHYASTGNRLFVGFVHQVNYEALYALEQVMGSATQPCLIAASEFEVTLSVASSLVPLQEWDSTGCKTVSEIAGALCSYGASTGADHISIIRCGSMVWSRLRKGAKIADLLFSEPDSMKNASSYLTTSHHPLIEETGLSFKSRK